ncbi:hypothetical protein F442_11595 [Phytophthora nicotianae P10297]|uniref:Chromo domain-containing protein n=2 Tax=Phytophthora nicotianae TaxID=4792 RepID=W2Z1H1_PHYNI|nr:hypothetical protein F442_11595 [Phytophthora nicotianae P10297]
MPPAYLAPTEAPQREDAAAVQEFVQQRESIIRYVRDAIAAVVDRQKENTDHRGRRNVERLHVGDQVLLSTNGISPTHVANLRASKLAPRYIGSFKVMKVIGDAYRLQLPSALRLHPTFYVGRLRCYHPATIPSGNQPPRGAAPTSPVTSLGSPAPAAPRAALDVPPDVPTPSRDRFLRDGPAPLVDRDGNLRHIVEAILDHDDSASSRSARRCDESIPGFRRYLVRWIGPLNDSWEPRSTLLEDVPGLVEAYESALSAREDPPGAAANRAVPRTATGVVKRQLAFANKNLIDGK